MSLFPQVSKNSFCTGWEEGMHRWEVQERTLRVKSSLRSLMIEGGEKPLREKAPLFQTEGHRLMACVIPSTQGPACLLYFPVLVGLALKWEAVLPFVELFKKPVNYQLVTLSLICDMGDLHCILQDHSSQLRDSSRGTQASAAVT